MSKNIMNIYQKTEYKCPLILIYDDDEKERLCGKTLVITEEGDLLCSDCEETFLVNHLD